MSSSNTDTQTTTKQEEEHSPWGIPLAVAMLATAGGLCMYTRRSTSMLKQMETVAKNQALRKGSMKPGPSSKKN